MIPLAASAFLTSLGALIRTYRVAGVLAMLSGAASVVLGVFLIPATKSILHLPITLGNVLNNIMFTAKLETYAAIPMGATFIVGGVLTLWASGSRNGRARE
jgi:uncharacterized membrane protein